jgi:hypothetical protein
MTPKPCTIGLLMPGFELSPRPSMVIWADLCVCRPRWIRRYHPFLSKRRKDGPQSPGGDTHYRVPHRRAIRRSFAVASRAAGSRSAGASHRRLSARKGATLRALASRTHRAAGARPSTLADERLDARRSRPRESIGLAKELASLSVSERRGLPRTSTDAHPGSRLGEPGIRGAPASHSRGRAGSIPSPRMPCSR